VAYGSSVNTTNWNTDKEDYKDGYNTCRSINDSLPIHNHSALHVSKQPLDDIVTSFENINATASDAHIESASSYGRTVFNMIFAGLAIVPMLWFIVWVFHREPDWGYR